MIVPLYKGKGERAEYRNHRGISLLSVVERIRAVTEGLIDNEHRCFRATRMCVDQIFTLKQIEYVGFINLEKTYDRVNMEALFQVLKMLKGGGDRVVYWI